MKQLMWILAALVIIAATGSGLIGIANLFPASLTKIDTSCSVLKPNFITYKCEKGETAIATENAYVCGLYQCVRVQCSYSDLAEYERCEIKLNYNWHKEGEWQQSFQHPSSEVAYLNFGESAVFTANPGWGTPLTATIRYPQKVLSIYTSTGIFSRRLGTGCDLSVLLGNEAYNNLPKDMKKTMKVGDTQLSVESFQSYPVLGNFVNYNGQDAICVYTGQGTIYKAERYDTPAICYYYQGTVLAVTDCCPGTTGPMAQSCVDGKWSTGVGGCCDGGFCSDAKCQSQGSWDWDNFAGSKVYRYGCNQITGKCEVVESKNAQCNPYNNYGCPLTQTCDIATLICVDKPKAFYTCVEAGYECCESGMFASNIGLRTCDQAGKSSYICVDGFCRPPRPSTDCNFNAICDVALGETRSNCPEDCKSSWLDNLAGLLGVFIAALAISAILVGIGAFFLFPPLLLNKKLLIGAILGFALLLTLLFSPLVVGAVFAASMFMV